MMLLDKIPKKEEFAAPEVIKRNKAMRWLKEIFIKYSSNLLYRNISILELLLPSLCRSSKYFNSVGEVINTVNRNKVPKPKNYNILPHLIKVYFPIQTFYRRYIEKEQYKKDNYKIFIPICGNNYISPIKPLLPGLNKENLKPLLVKFESLFNIQAKENLEKLNLDYKIAEKYLDKNSIKLIKSEFKRINQEFNKLINNKEFQDEFAYKGIKWSYVKGAFKYFYKRGYIHELLFNIEYIHTILKKEEPKLCVVTESINPVSKSLILLSKSKNIPILYLPHDLVGSLEPFPLIVNKVACWGKYSRDELIKRDIDRKKLSITGNSQTDYAYNIMKNYNKNKIYEELKLPRNKKIIVLATNQISNQENTVLVNSVLDAIKDLKDTQLIIKLHPIEKEGFYKKLTKNTNTIIFKDIDLYKLLYISDLVITYFSTVGLEAMIFNKPVMTVNLFNFKEVYPFAKSGAALGIYKKEDIKLSIENCLYNKKFIQKIEEKQKEFIKHTLYKIDGKSIQRTIKLIKEMLKK